MYMIPTADVLLRQYCELLLELSRLECQWLDGIKHLFTGHVI